jgi:hypothetical protein
MFILLGVLSLLCVGAFIYLRRDQIKTTYRSRADQLSKHSPPSLVSLPELEDAPPEKVEELDHVVEDAGEHGDYRLPDLSE